MGILWTFINLQLFINVCLAMSSTLLSTEVGELETSSTMMSLNSLKDTATLSAIYSSSISPSSPTYEQTVNTAQSSPHDYSSSVDSHIKTQETVSPEISSLPVSPTVSDNNIMESSMSRSFVNTEFYSTINTTPVSSLIEQSSSKIISRTPSVESSGSLEQTSLITTQTGVISSSEVSYTELTPSVSKVSSDMDIEPTRTVFPSESHVTELSSSSVYISSSENVSLSLRTEPLTGSPLLMSTIVDSSGISTSSLDSKLLQLQSVMSTSITSNTSSSLTLNFTSSLALPDVTSIYPTSTSYFQTQQTVGLVRELSSISVKNSTEGSTYDFSSSYSTKMFPSILEPSLQTTSNFTSLDGASLTTLMSESVSTSSRIVSASESYTKQQSSEFVNVTISASTLITPSKSFESKGVIVSATVSHNVTASYFGNVTCEIEFEGDCELLTNNKVVLGEFWEAFVVILSDILPVKRKNIKPKDIACKPIRLSFYILDVESPNLRKKLADYVTTGQLSVPVLLDSSLEMYNAVSVKLDPEYKEHDDRDDIFAVGLRQVDIIVIISACLVSLVLICVGFFICAREYYYKKRTRSFDLSDVVHWNMNMEDYTLTKIPRPKPTYSDKGVKMNSFRKKNGCSSQELKAQVENIPTSAEKTNGKVLTDVQLRMDSNSNGLIVGVTGTSDPLLPANQKSPTHSDKSCDKNYDSEDNLYEDQNSPLHCADNPIYYADDDRFSSV